MTTVLDVTLPDGTPNIGAPPAPLIDDDLALVAPWGVDPGDCAAPTLLLRGAENRIVPAAHGEWLAGRHPRAELRVVPGHGHLSVLEQGVSALEWLAEVSR